jgi:transcriptional regulator with XRE-family HTH domain
VSQIAARLNLAFKPSVPSIPEEHLRKLAMEGRTKAEAARELRASQTRVNKLATEMGLSFRPPWRRVRAPTTELGKILQRARFEAGYSYGRLGELTGLHRGHIMLIERGRVRRPTDRTLRVLADGLDGYASYDELCQAAWTGRPPPSEERLKQLARQGLTRTEAAHELGVSPKHVGKLASKYGISLIKAWPEPKPPGPKLGRILQEARLAAGYSFSRLSALAGLHRRHVIDLETGRIRCPTDRTLRALADCLDGYVSYDALARAVQETAVASSSRSRGHKRYLRQTRAYRN